MQHLPKPALILGEALRAQFDCSQPLPDQFNVLLCLLDGGERRRRLQARLNAGQIMKFDMPADVHWMPADQVAQTRDDGRPHERHFNTLRTAIDFVLHELPIAARANVWLTTADGNLTMEQIERLQWKASEA